MSPDLFNPNRRHFGQLSRLDRFALWITKRVGTLQFFLIIAIWSWGWLLWNTLAPKPWRFDPYPAFALWLFISNLLQILLMPLMLVGQNLLGRHSEIRAESDFKVNVKALKELEELRREVAEIRQAIQRSPRGDIPSKP
ncbi:MAG: DUF1003 domain-containing protein [Flavobacteriales bacterium]|nr:DUF1003 domain-containing protein [Flavobacteriales bacterium]MCX7649865.1 DUF1003 domain-containing protein [Flavobacteriales bacterium]MDW8432913.1 DUF1003 domain-containing protein [Flavobacteriales bacterium]